jgi:GMP synthase (glutamine-hydrolysing)
MGQKENILPIFSASGLESFLSGALLGPVFRYRPLNGCGSETGRNPGNIPTPFRHALCSVPDKTLEKVAMILFVQNDAPVPAGCFGELLQARKTPFRIWRPFAGEPVPPLDDFSGVIVLGGYMGVHDGFRFPYLLEVKRFMGRLVATQTPMLGICLGGQLLAEVLGGKVTAKCGGERGLHSVNLNPEGITDPLFQGFSQSFAAFQWHEDSFDLPPGGIHLANSAACSCQVFRFGSRAYGLQFHPEVDRAIVASWSGSIDPEGSFLAEFEAGANTHRGVSHKLLENFLGLAGTEGQSGSMVQPGPSGHEEGRPVLKKG